MSTENNAKLLELNYNAQLDALREIGLLGENETIPLGDIADYMKWAGGLLDVQLAKVDKTTGQLALFTTDDWDNALSSNEKDNYQTLGVRVRAERQDFLVSKEDMKTSVGESLMPWSSVRENVEGLTDYGEGSTGIYDDFDASGMTDAIVNFAGGVAYLPAQLSRAYKACTVANDGVDDPVEWSLATVAHLRILSKYREQINAVISNYIGANYKLQNAQYWSANEYNKDVAYFMWLGSGYLNFNPANLGTMKSQLNIRARAVCAL